MRKLISTLAVVLLFIFASCDTDPAADVTYHSATLHGNVRCQQGSYDAYVQYEIRKVGATFESVGPQHLYSCHDEQGAERDIPATSVDDLDWGTTYEFRLRSPNGHTYDADGTQDGSNYDSFTTPIFSTVAAKPARALRDSIGINVRLAYSNPYGNCAKNKEALAYLGIRFIRDTKHYNWHTGQAQCYRELQAMGVKGTLMLGDLDRDNNSQCDSPNHEFQERLDALRADPQLRAFVDAIESVNEPDIYTAFPGWPACLLDYQQRLYQAVNGEWPVIGPSWAAGGWKVNFDQGQMAPFMDVCNVHAYPESKPPGVSWDVSKASCDASAPGKPIQGTELGYHSEILGINNLWHLGVNEQVQASYTLRLALEHYRKGARRTDFFTIVEHPTCRQDNSSVSENDWGWYDCNWNPRLVAHAMHNFTQAIGDGTPELTPLAWRTDVAPADLQRLTFRRDDGRYAVALWRTASQWDISKRIPVAVGPVTVKVTLPDAEGVSIVRPVESAVPASLALEGDQVSFTVSGEPLILLIEPEPV